LRPSDLLEATGRRSRWPRSKDAVTADGDVSCRLILKRFGFLAQGRLCAPVTSGTTPKNHTLHLRVLGACPSLSVGEKRRHAEGAALLRCNSGCMLDQLSWTMQRSGLVTATAPSHRAGRLMATVSGGGHAERNRRYSRFAPLTAPSSRKWKPFGHGGLGRDHPMPNNLEAGGDHPR